ncbi:hypothetical protein [Enhygromyxa salina]|uniref:HTTM domain-containing protein n=1 Tax=Enhygromyxa salina TaxID=215803 RepID=A0A2S9XQI4_9BACT|nr:hypothetical protein [Enhygromyxa salina]PRP95115.1 hypothetical protein ENSA7_74290 [Enhygromyxa salina]
MIAARVRDLIQADAPWSVEVYRVYRMVLGLYLLVHFAHLMPWAAELFSSAGVLPDAGLSPYVRALPNILGVYDAPWFCVAWVGLGAVLSVMLTLGRGDRWAAVGLWVIWASLFGRNPLISNPGLPYVGLLLIVHALTPAAGPIGQPRPSRWAMPASSYAVVWILMAVGYSYSGLIKLGSPSWIDGSALTHVLTGPLARSGGLGASLLALPKPLLQVMTWGALGMELSFAVVALSSRARPYVWAAGLLMHLSLMVLVDFADLSVGMVMLHSFTFDQRWFVPPTFGARAPASREPRPA